MWRRPAADFGGHADPATPLQYGRAIRLFEQLGYTDRDDRLTAAAVLLGLDGLGSFRDLSKGKCGWLVEHVGACETRAELDAAIRAATLAPLITKSVAVDQRSVPRLIGR